MSRDLVHTHSGRLHCAADSPDVDVLVIPAQGPAAWLVASPRAVQWCSACGVDAPAAQPGILKAKWFIRLARFSLLPDVLITGARLLGGAVPNS